MATSDLYLGSSRPLGVKVPAEKLYLPAHHLVTHAVVVGSTGSGKTGLEMVMVEEALRNQVPVLVIDVKGDLPNLLLAFPGFAPSAFLPWIEGCAAPNDPRSPEEIAVELAASREAGLALWGIGEAELLQYREQTRFRVITPGATAGELLHVLSSLERPSERWHSDPEAARNSLSAAISLVLRLIGRDPDPAKSREHVLLTVLAERRLQAGNAADLAALLEDIARPPIDRIGALTVDAYMPKTERKILSAALNSLLASPAFASWRQGATLDVGEWLSPVNGKTPAVVLSVAHLDDEERALVLGVVMEELLTWVRSLPGTQRLRALVVFDELYGFLPPHPSNPPTKRPLVSLMKQARAFGVGMVLATQNPMDLDYRALSNAGIWCVGKLQTDADRARVLESLASSDSGHGMKVNELSNIVKRLTQRWFVMRDSHSDAGLCFMQPRWTFAYMRGPMTRHEIQLGRELSGSAVPGLRLVG